MEQLFAEKRVEDKQVLLLESLKNLNPQYVEEKNGEIVIYHLIESKGSQITLSQLPHYLNVKLNRDPRFQRDSNDHKQRTPQQIVMDYLSLAYEHFYIKMVVMTLNILNIFQKKLIIQCYTDRSYFKLNINFKFPES